MTRTVAVAWSAVSVMVSVSSAASSSLGVPVKSSWNVCAAVSGTLLVTPKRKVALSPSLISADVGRRKPNSGCSAVGTSLALIVNSLPSTKLTARSSFRKSAVNARRNISAASSRSSSVAVSVSVAM